VYASYLVENAIETFELLEVAFGEQTVGSSYLFSEVRAVLCHIEDAECAVCPSASRTDENMDRTKEHDLENRRTLSMRLLESGNFFWVISKHFE